MFADMSHTGAAASRRVAKKNPMQLLVDLIEGDPTADNKRLFRAWWKIIKTDDDYLEAVAWHAFTNIAEALRRSGTRPKPKRGKAYVAAERAAVASLVKKVEGVVLMNLKMPNGKLLKDCTFAECSAAGGWFKLLATKGKPSEVVGEKLTEAELKAMR